MDVCLQMVMHHLILNVFVEKMTVLEGDASMNSKLVVAGDVSLNSKVTVADNLSSIRKFICSKFHTRW